MPRTSARSQDRTNDEAAGFALAHRARVEILRTLYEAERSESELSRLLHLPQSTIQYHLLELLNAGSIEIVGTRRIRGLERRFYRAAVLGDYLVDEIATWSFEKRQTFWGHVIQGSGAEAMSALHAGCISRQDRSWLGWARFNFDAEGWADAYDAFEELWNRVKEIQAEADARHEAKGAELRTFVCSLQGYPRSRPGRSSYPKPGA